MIDKMMFYLLIWKSDPLFYECVSRDAIYNQLILWYVYMDSKQK